MWRNKWYILSYNEGMREYLVIFGDIERGNKPNGIEFANVIKTTDRMMLPEALLHIIPKHVMDQKLTTGNDYVIPELFKGDISFKNK